MAQLAVIIPAYNENSSLPQLMERLDRSLRSAHISYIAIVIDDHSTDGTYRTATRLQQKYPLSIYRKQGVRGKAQSILEGLSHTRSEYVVMIDADLQYPPEAIPEMLAFAMEKKHGVVVARRKVYEESTVRRLGSRGLAFLCGRLLHGFDCDIQSGLKLFKREIVRYIDPRDISPWSLDLPLLHTAKELGHTIGQVEIDFVKRAYGDSKLSLIKPTLQIIHSAVKLKFRRISPEQTLPTTAGSMAGAGVKYRGTHFVTHSTLHHSKSALTVITQAQRSVLFVLLGAFLIGIGLSPLVTFQVIVAILSFIYFIDVVFNFFLILKSLHSPPEISPSKKEIAALNDKDLPIYTILCPLYKEAHVIPQFVEAISAMDWPKNKLEVMLLLEEDDTYSVEAVKRMKLPSYIRAVVVPDSQPKTKPKACNYGLNLAKGEYVVIYDAEDKPAVDQLKKAYLAFQTVGPQVKCLQAKLNYYNPTQNWLTRLFTAEYSLWFDVILTGLQSIGTTIPLGGTSNHFRTVDLLEFEGWDPFNVTEDCDLGVRLFKKGAQTAIIDSTTLEEANSNFHNWIRQRSRWIKGYMQTYLLHMRDPMDFASSQGIHAVLFQLTVGGKIAFILINPILWVLTIAYFVLYRFVGPTIESLYPTTVFYMAVTSLIFGNFMFIYYYMIGAAKREHWGLMKWIYLIPFYWLMVSIAGAMALYQLIVKPHYWEKTIHGLHLKKEFEADLATSVLTEGTLRKTSLPARLMQKLKHTEYRSGMIFVVAAMGANVLNMLTSLYTGSQLKFVDFAVVNTFTSLLYLIGIPLGALSVTINHHTAKLLGKYNVTSAQSFWRLQTKRSIAIALICSGLWLTAIPVLKVFFHYDSISPLLWFTPLIMIGIVKAVSSGYVGGRLLFAAAGISGIVEALIRLIATIILGKLSPEFIYVSLPISGLVGALITIWYASRGQEQKIEDKEYILPGTFFSLALLMKISAIAFFSLDNIFVAHFLSAQDTGKYGVLGLIGKMIFFAGSLSIAFILPVVSNLEGKGKSSEHVFRRLTMITATVSMAADIALGIVLPIIAPLFLGAKINAIREYLPIYGLGILFYTISQAILQYHLAKRQYSFAVASFVIAILQVLGLALFHGSLWQVVIVMGLSGSINCLVLFLMHYFHSDLEFFQWNFQDFLDIFRKLPRIVRPRQKQSSGLRVLIFNWRDTRHVWAGGAEEYIQRLAAEWVKAGVEVTVFCGSDERSPRNENIDGVRIVRRGGFYTVYFWAFLYYVVKFRGQFDAIIDSENGVPFFSPLYSHLPVFLLVHHVHQNVFRANLPLPLAMIAQFAEGTLMPFVYRRAQIVTVSESSKKDLLRLMKTSKQSIHIVNPGVTLPDSRMRVQKAIIPTLSYIGRLRKYKNLDIAIAAFAKVQAQIPQAQFVIAGDGDAIFSIKRQVKALGLEDSVKILGKISDSEKHRLLMRSWVMIQPSSFEGWGMTVVEANVCGTPVIASNVNGLRDSVVNGKTGILFPEKNVEALSKAMLSLCKDRSIRAYYTRNAKTWSNDFSWAAKSTQFLTIVESSIHTTSESRYSIAYARAESHE